MLHGINLALRKTKIHMIYLSPKVTCQALKSSEGGTVGVVYMADLGARGIWTLNKCVVRFSLVSKGCMLNRKCVNENILQKNKNKTKKVADITLVL